MVEDGGCGTGPSAFHPFPWSIAEWDLFAIGEGAEGFKSLVAKDPEPLAQLGEINP
jgi:hypothetical protein